jgi:hypothetical protein
MLALAPMNSGIFLYNLFFTSVSHKQATATEITILSFCSTSPLGTLRFPVLGQLELLNKTHGQDSLTKQDLVTGQGEAVAGIHGLLQC